MCVGAGETATVDGRAVNHRSTNDPRQGADRMETATAAGGDRYAVRGDTRHATAVVSDTVFL